MCVRLWGRDFETVASDTTMVTGMVPVGGDLFSWSACHTTVLQYVQYYGTRSTMEMASCGTTSYVLILRFDTDITGASSRIQRAIYALASWLLPLSNSGNVSFILARP